MLCDFDFTALLPDKDYIVFQHILKFPKYTYFEFSSFYDYVFIVDWIWINLL